eukprot:TRINITY_DN29693_c0_g1_i1.p1 TRINITY_DN29693_c0_g1~~TRINITY_DN29693_c0_g1_i1.p1  ORF type:complete len:291 (-),score=46.52 TRINITY_DN29693_c0_g1_i1:119-991(-)
MCAAEPTWRPSKSNASRAYAPWDVEKENALPSVALQRRTRTCIILDWDDTIFPLTYVVSDLRLDPHMPLKEQSIPDAMKKEVASRLASCAEQAKKLLTAASDVGNVAVVTLAQDPWITESCQNFCPQLLETIQALGVTVCYAQPNTPDDQSLVTSRPAQEKILTELKAKSIGQCLRNFCQQCCDEGDALHALSIGDSEFERLGTRLAVEELSRSLGRNFAAEVYTKTFKTMEKPTVAELTSQLAQLAAWLPSIASAREALDLALADVDDRRCIQAVEQKLKRATGFGSVG